MVNTSELPIPGPLDNSLSSCGTNSQDSRTRTIVLCFDGTNNQFCETVRRSAAVTSTQIHH